MRIASYNITYIAGAIGCGKSNLAAKIAQQYLKRGWRVYANHSIYGCYKFELKDLATYCMPANSVVIVDESGLEMNSRDFKNMSKDLLTYYKKARHYKNKVFVLSQTFSDTDKQIRELATNVLFIRPIIPHVLSMPVKVSGSLQVGQDGQPCMMYKIGKVAMPYYLPKYFKYYDSFEDDDKRPIIQADKYKYEEIPPLHKRLFAKVQNLAERSRKLVAERVVRLKRRFRKVKS